MYYIYVALLSLPVLTTVATGSQSRESLASLYGPRCLSCSGVADPGNCSQTVQCWASQQCFSERYVHTDGISLYNFGCKIKDECDLIEANSGRRKRVDISIDLCEQCCHGDLCNVHHCTNSTVNSVSCYECENEGNPNDCHSLKRCSANQACYAEKVISDSPHPKHTLGCIPKVICGYLESPPAVGKRSVIGSRNKRDTHLCQKCCHVSGCNAHLCESAQGTTPSVNTQAHTITPFEFGQSTTSVATTPGTQSHPSSTRVSSTPRSSDIRLVHGHSSNEGTVEIFVREQWGTICDDNFNQNSAQVICRMLGYPEETISQSIAWGKGHFGSGTGPIWLDDVKCAGSEANIYECTHKQYGDNDCSKNEDAGVTCYVRSCPFGFHTNGESCYSISILEKVESLAEAKMECAKKNATIASVDSVKKQDYLVTELKNRTNADTGEWLTGGHKVSGRWIWEATGQAIDNSLLNWGPGEPGRQACLSLWGQYGMKYADVICDGNARNYICEIQLH